MQVKNTLTILLFSITISSLSAKNKQTLPTGWSSPYYHYLKNKPSDVLNAYFCKAATTQKIVAITFDDGFVPNTKLVMDYLQKNNIPATFFVLMGRKEMTSDVFKKYDNPLFEVGMHSFYHDDYRKVSRARLEQDFNYCTQRAKSRSPNRKIRYFRPPYGVVDSYATELMQKKHLQGVLWSTDSRDWAGLKGQKLTDNVMKELGTGSIILMHDHIYVNDLDMLCKEIKRQGYKIVPLSKLLSFKAEYPN